MSLANDIEQALPAQRPRPQPYLPRMRVAVTRQQRFQFVDEFGIHVVPEVRYTRWINPTFDNLTTSSQRNQVEAAISLTF